MSFHARLAVLGDEPALADVHRQSFGDEAWGKGYWTGAFADRACRSFLMLAEANRPCGLLACQLVLDEADILTFGVIPERRRSGVGAALLSFGLEHLAGAGVRRVTLDVAVSNVAACALYAGAGFAEVGRRPKYYANRADALILEKRL